MPGGREVAAKKKRKNKKRKKCAPDCAGKTCGKDGCGGSCGACNGSCVNGTCVCPSGSRNCNGVCQQCCTDLHCEGGRTCQLGTCACPPNQTFCTLTNVCGECCDNRACCGDIICTPFQPRCLVNRTCGCEDGRPLCAANLCCPAGFDCIGMECAAQSDRDLKVNVTIVDAADVLDRVRELPISTWNYIADDPLIRHVGPMAQDFAALFGVGSDDRHIHPIDGQGVALAAIQGLIGEIEQLRSQNLALAARVTALEPSLGVGDSRGDE
jgi:hypothetical protein